MFPSPRVSGVPGTADQRDGKGQRANSRRIKGAQGDAACRGGTGLACNNILKWM